eukprot:SAG22_NODE_2672_length_2317_cov_6.085212_4_plen_60_part_00
MPMWLFFNLLCGHRRTQVGGCDGQSNPQTCSSDITPLSALTSLTNLNLNSQKKNKSKVR